MTTRDKTAANGGGGRGAKGGRAFHEGELVALRKLAEEFARKRKERVTTGHLLAAIADRRSVAADLLKDRLLDVDVLLKAARVVIDDAPDAIGRAVQRAREFAARSTFPEPSGIHLLYALCQDRTCAAHRAITQCGTDVTKLRTSALQLATGIAMPRRVSSLAQMAPAPMTPVMPKAAPHAPHPPHAPIARAPKPAPTPRISPPAGMPPPASVPPSSLSSPVISSPVISPPAMQPPAPGHRRRTRPAPHAPMTTPRTVHAPNLPKAPAAKPAPIDAAKGGNTAARFALDPKVFPLLTQIGTNLTLAAALGQLDPAIGREPEIERTLDVLAKRHANSACLVGEPGVGKTSIVRGMARRIAAGERVSSLDDRVLVAIEPPVLLAGTGMRGQLAERMTQLLSEVKKAEGRIVLVFEEIHTLFATTNDGGEEGISELKSALASGQVNCIGTSSPKEYRRVIESDGALARRFSVVEVEEPANDEALAIMESVIPLFEGHHRARYAKEALEASLRWSVRYLPGRALPDKSIGVLDLAGARSRRRGLDEVGTAQVAEVVAELAGVPTERLLETDADRMLRFESLLAKRIVGHSDALARIAAVLRRNASGFRTRRPIGSFLLLGPTGVGKTETAKAIAELLFHSDSAMTRLDLSEYAEPHAVSRLVGAPPGYIGHEAGGFLTEAVRRRPYQVVLLDEIEKAHRDVLEAFLQVFDDGRLTDGRGRTVDFTNTVILLTSNIGADVARPRTSNRRIGFAPDAEERSEATAYADAIVAAARATLPPELYNRLDEVMAFAPLTRADVAEVARRMLASLAAELERTRGIRLDASERAIAALLDLGGFDPELGARPMRRTIARHVEAPIAEMLLRSELRRGDIATVDVEDGALVVDAVTP